VLIGITGICIQLCISGLVLSASDICGDMFVVDNTEFDRNTRKERDSYLFRARKLDMEMVPDSLEVGGVNELFVVVTIFLCLREV